MDQETFYLNSIKIDENLLNIISPLNPITLKPRYSAYQETDANSRYKRVLTFTKREN